MSAQGVTLSRKCGCGGSCGSCSKDESLLRSPSREAAPSHAPSIVHDVLRSQGRPLDTPTRASMESRFGHDFSRVRVHDGDAAAASAHAVSARAYTVGQHIVLGANAAGDPRLMAHELTHTIQQSDAGGGTLAPSLEIGSASSPAEREADRAADAVAANGSVPPIAGQAPAVARAPEDDPQKEAPPVKGKVTAGGTAGKCGRKTDVRVPGFDNSTAGPHISAIAVDIKTNDFTDVTLTWAKLPATATVPANPLHGSPGAGKCEIFDSATKKNRPLDCSDNTDSNTTDSLCTPIGSFNIEGYQCTIGGPATQVSWFKAARGIAFHNYDDVPKYPASHGCVRMATVGGVGGADWIYDNTIPSVTTVTVKRAAGDPGPQCWKRGALGARPGYTPPAPTGTTAPGTTAPSTTTPTPGGQGQAPDAGAKDGP